MHILIIGGTRFMGPYIVKNLHAEGHQVTIFHRGQTKASLPEGTREILGNRDQLLQHTDIFKHLEPDVVLDMMATTEKQAQAFLSVFAGIARRAVVISSQDVYRAFGRVNGHEEGEIDLSPITEDAPLREHLYPYRGKAPRNADDPLYWMDDYDKILVERIAMSSPELPATILRLPAVYGPLDFQHRMFPYLKRMQDGRSIILLEEKEARWRWTHGYVENVADAITLAITDERASGHIYNVGEPFALSLTKRVEQIAQAAHWHGRIVALPAERVPESIRWGINADQHIIVDTNRLRKELGYSEHIDLTEAFRRTIAWESANPPEEIDANMFNYQAEDQALAGH